MEYRLSDEAIARRARANAVVATLSAMAPAVFTVLALYQMNFVPRMYLGLVLGLLTALAAARIYAGYIQMGRQLRAFSVVLSDAADAPLVIETRRGRHELPRPSVARVREIDGVLGGLRVDLAAGWDGGSESPEFVDVPRGGERFAELRAAFEEIRPVERPRRRGKLARAALACCVIFGIFFLPFFLDDLFGRSKVLAVGLVLVVWVGLRLVVRR